MNRLSVVFTACLMLLLAQAASAVTITIGDVDGFGFVNPNSWENAQGGSPDTNGNGIIEDGEFLPDLDDDGHVWVTGSDEFDNRSAAEIAATDGAQWTDVSLENYFDHNGAGTFGLHPADDALFTFTFTAPTLGDSDYGVDHFINLIFGDYDVSPASILVDGVNVALTTQPPGQDGLVQLAYATVAWADMLDGEVIIDLYAPSEPYVAIDYAYLHTEATAAPIPGPSSILLLLLGLAGIRLSRR